MLCVEHNGMVVWLNINILHGSNHAYDKWSNDAPVMLHRRAGKCRPSGSRRKRETVVHTLTRLAWGVVCRLLFEMC